MKYQDKTWQELNTLLSFLRQSNVVTLVDNYYRQYGNDAPGRLLDSQIHKLQVQLDNAYKVYEMNTQNR